MLSSIQKFSTSIFAKILLVIIIIPFVFWGMGSTFRGGDKNVIVVIEKEKHTVQEFIKFIEQFVSYDQKITTGQIEQFLSNFVGEKLIQKEVEDFKIKISDISLSKLIKNDENFKRDNKFSRLEYEKFLLKNNITAPTFESNFSRYEKKKQLLNLIGDGISPSKYLINMAYDKINQKRNIELINLNNIFEINNNVSESQIENYFNENKNKYEETFKSIKFVELTPKNLIGNENFTDDFYKKVDEIDFMLIEGNKLEDVSDKYNLQKVESLTLNKLGKNLNTNKITEINKNIAKNIFDLEDLEQTSLVEYQNKYFIVEIVKTEKIQNAINDNTVRSDILLNLKNAKKRKLASEIISKINSKKFHKSDFYKLSKDKEIPISKIEINNKKDNKVLEKEVVEYIYAFPEKKNNYFK